MFYASVSLYLIPKQFFLPKVSAYIFFVGIEVAVCSYMYIGTYGAGGYITYYYLINSCGGLTLMKSRASILRRVTEESRKDFLKKMMDDGMTGTSSTSFIMLISAVSAFLVCMYAIPISRSIYYYW